MGSRVKSRIMCVNCNICVNKLRRYPVLLLDSKVTTLVCNWVNPKIILENDCICEACRDLAMAAVNNNLKQEVCDSEEVELSTKGHFNVCLLCGCSLLSRQSDVILKEDYTEMQLSICKIIISRVALQEVFSSDRVCHACWLRTKREVIRNNRQDETRPQLTIDNDEVQQEQNSSQPSSEPTPAMETQKIVLPI